LLQQSFPDIYFCNYPHIDFAFVDFVLSPVILAMLKILIGFTELWT